MDDALKWREMTGEWIEAAASDERGALRSRGTLVFFTVSWEAGKGFTGHVTLIK